MVHLAAVLEPHVGARIVSRLDADARRRADEAPTNGGREPFERHLADALAARFSGDGPARSGRTELVVLVSHEVTQRDWSHVAEGEHCKIPGVGPIAPQIARQIAQDAFLTGVFYDGTDLRHLKRWTRHIPQPVRIALHMGDPPDFDGRKCVDCGRRFRLEFDHIHPFAAGGPTSLANGADRCPDCHRKKTRNDLRPLRRAGRLKGRETPLPLPP
jgi:5-methylcytosine-specific restriction endonuclease McrA